MKKILKFLKETKWYGYVIAISLFIFQYLIYRLAAIIASALEITPFLPKIDFIDNRIPLIPFFVVFYVYSYLFWTISFVVVSATEKRNYKNFLIGIIISLLLGFLIFSFLPSYMDRTSEDILCVYDKNDIFSKMLSIIYKGDGGNIAYNLFPSYHCLLSTYSFLGICKDEKIKKGFKIFSLISVILIILSTLFTKQHYIIDSIVGSLISIIIYTIINIINKKRETK